MKWTSCETKHTAFPCCSLAQDSTGSMIDRPEFAETIATDHPETLPPPLASLGSLTFHS